ncbi:hypothetical protein RRF57_006084 [Xylaria bambusicola]|uniref:Thymocyte nuclear protein 1 n=1 Tax=Xylaria bambusicola TaxID=326684 RepID=A0AAN7UN69_9PEZI
MLDGELQVISNGTTTYYTMGTELIDRPIGVVGAKATPGDPPARQQTSQPARQANRCATPFEEKTSGHSFPIVPMYTSRYITNKRREKYEQSEGTKKQPTAMPKRKTTDDPPAVRRSSRRKVTAPDKKGPNEKGGDTNTKNISNKIAQTPKAASPKLKSKTSPPKTAQPQVSKPSTIQPNTNNNNNNNKRSAKPTAPATETIDDDDSKTSSPDRWYWLMKAEPESRFENGVDVKFSIDDLACKKEPEPWDGIRAYAARNNLRSMKKGELAFFYHSNCKEPGLVGTMEIVQEHTPDLSAHDPKAPYYDPSSKPVDPKWSVVHVKFRSKFVRPIGLKELREMGKPGEPLENMQMLKQTRLSVSRVSPAEWDYLMNLVQRQGGEVSEI